MPKSGTIYQGFYIYPHSSPYVHRTSSVLQLLKHSKMPLLLPEVRHLVLHCIVQCRELCPYPEELDNNWFYPASAPALSFHQVCTCFCLISCEPIVAATVLSTLAHAPESSPDWSWEHYCQEEEEEDTLHSDPKMKSDILSRPFVSVFTTEGISPLPTLSNRTTQPVLFMCHIMVLTNSLEIWYIKKLLGWMEYQLDYCKRLWLK